MPSDFNKRMKKRGEQVISGTTKAMQKALVAADQVAVSSTPVDTGFHRSNWIATLQIPSTQVIEQITNLAKSHGLDSVLARVEPGVSAFLSNNGPAIQLLDKGSSAQAPKGMSAGAVAAARAVLRRHRLLKG